MSVHVLVSFLLLLVLVPLFAALAGLEGVEIRVRTTGHSCAREGSRRHDTLTPMDAFEVLVMSRCKTL
jgi:hypothetical protein